MRRRLGGFETAAVLTAEASAFNVVIALRLASGPEPERLERALGVLQKRHPLLGVRIAGSGGRRAFETEGTPPIPLRIVERRGDEDWRRVVEEELDGGPDLAVGPLLDCAYLPSPPPGPCEIVLSAHHAAIDGASSVPLLRELLTLCGGEPEGAPEAEFERSENQPPSLPPAAENLYPPRYRGLRRLPGQLAFLGRQLADELRYRRASRGTRRPPIHETARCRTLSVALPEEATRRLVRAARRRRVTLNGALTAAQLLAVHQHLYRGQEVPMRYFSFADLRPSLVPRPPDGRLAGYVVPLRYTVAVGPDRELWPLAREITLQVNAGARRGDRFHAVRLMPAMMRSILALRTGRMGTAAMSYAGRVRLAPRYGKIEVRGMHAFVSNIALGPEHSALVKLFRGRLLWDTVYLDADMDDERAKRVAGTIVETLADARVETLS